MSALKVVSLVILSFFLFVFLIVFSAVFTTHQVALNPHFISGIVNKIDFTEIAREGFDQSDTADQIPVEVRNAVIDTLDAMQPTIKARMTVAIDETYDYLKRRNPDLDLQTILGDSFMNPDTVASLLKDVDLSNIVEQSFNDPSADIGFDIDAEMQQAIVNTIDGLEPSFKAQIVAASDPIFKYLLEKSPSIDVRQTFRQTLLSRDFTTALIDNLDIKTATESLLQDQLGQLPEGIDLNTAQVDQILTVLEPAIKTGLKNAADPIADYLVGARPDFTVTISLQSAMPDIKNVVVQAYLHQNLPDLQGLSQAEIDAAANAYWSTAQSFIPADFEIDSSMFGPGITSGVDDFFTGMEDGLTEARLNIAQATDDVQSAFSDSRRYVGLVQLVYFLLILVLVLLAGGIILIHRSVKGSTLNLGIVLTAFGAPFFIGVMVLRFYIPEIVLQIDVNMESVRAVVRHVLISTTSPMFVFTLSCLVVGIALIVVSIFYRAPSNQSEG